MQFADSPHPSLPPSLGRVIDLNRVRVQSGNLRQILGVQNGAVFAVARLVRQRDEAGVTVRDVDNGAGQRQRLDDVVGVLNGTDVHRCDAGQHLAGYVRLHGQRNVAQVQVAAVRVRIEEGQIDALVPVMARCRIESVVGIIFQIYNIQCEHLRVIIRSGGVVVVVDLRQDANFVDNGFDDISEKSGKTKYLDQHYRANHAEMPRCLQIFARSVRRRIRLLRGDLSAAAVVRRQSRTGGHIDDRHGRHHKCHGQYADHNILH